VLKLIQHLIDLLFRVIPQSPLAPDQVKSLKIVAHRGCHDTGLVENTLPAFVWCIGNKKLMEQMNSKISPDMATKVIQEQKLGKTVSYISVDEKVKGYLTITDAIKETSKEAIALLLKMGVEVIMLTGDNKNTAQTVANELNLTSFQAECLPKDKLK